MIEINNNTNIKDYIDSNRYNDISKKDSKDLQLKLIPKIEQFVEHMYLVILKLPRTEKFNIGQDFKSVMHRCLEHIIYLSLCNDRKEKLYYCSLIDSEFKIQRIYIRIMYKQRYINEKKYLYCISLLDELGKMLGGYIKYAKNN
ncbi:MAG: four helix bundle protein [Clostridia bacterium]|nr:four helix bundle protein [Clostridia bacterium]MDD4375487.1 four helix bundle protein [Clostridia bacterium]